ncbi:selenoprotein L [Symphorus nematophorus]
MADGSDPAAVSCLKALAAFIENGKALLALAEKQSREDSLQVFIRQKIRIEQKQSLLALIEAAATLYRSCAALQDAVLDLQQLEVQWDAFLQRLDDELQLSAKILDGDHQSKCISADSSLINARTGEKVTLQKYLGKGKKILLVLIRQFSCLLCRLHLKDLEKNQRSLDAHSIEVVVVSFGCQEGAAHWLQETGCPFDMLLDSDRKMYVAFGLGASLKKVLNFSNMLLYAEYVVDNLEFPRGLPSIQDDMFQLGGDFVLDEHGRVLFSHCCQSPIDRPSVQDILSAQ